MVSKFSMEFCYEYRDVYIYLPDNYDEKVSYPVMYVFDGQNIFFDEDATYGRSWRMSSHIPIDMIVVAISSSKGNDNTRTEEYVLGYGNKHINVDTTINSLEKLMKEVNNSYNTFTDREHTFVCGSSFGALMALYATIKLNHRFSGCIAMSPSFCYKNVVKKFKKILFPLQPTKIYFDYGIQEIPQHLHIVNHITHMTKKLHFCNANMFVRYIQGEHCEEAWETRISDSINLICKK